ncbi:transcription cofactor vestigial-like protein 4 isoform X3 [Daktulosphaira vitifoliae]|uniref:transcription cofactor vestigial-like protein 4 isoform X3 n=1 Tax=Daktulosphaira vitifoliae TaxID=58002 RepID=UPI0021AA62C1|nr:transcription cofactor vestigial-like protein 4 isoform X3 [Daktulosphaira vitifoliae]
MSLCVGYNVPFLGFGANQLADARNNRADRSRHLWQPWVESSKFGDDDHSRSLSLRCSAMEGTVGTVGKWKRERRHRAVTSPVSPSKSFQEPLDMTTSSTNVFRAGNATKERASVIMTSTSASVVSRTPSVTTTTTTTGGMSDPVIDEHFRRSLGKDYMSVFAPAITIQEETTSNIPTENTGLSVDDHFAKALGDTWVKLQKEEYQKKRTNDNRPKVYV